MGKGQFLGEFEQVVLLAVLRLEAKAYGVTVRQEIEDRVGRAVSIGAVYATVNRLERKGYLESYGTDPVPVRGGRARRHFRLTQEGASSLRASRDMLGLLWDGIDIDTDASAV
jgi:DNA-binding PadR family transcriptional regulator